MALKGFSKNTLFTLNKMLKTTLSIMVIYIFLSSRRTLKQKLNSWWRELKQAFNNPVEYYFKVLYL